MPVALLNEIILMIVGMVIGYKVGTRYQKLTSLYNKLRGKQDV